MAYTEYQVERIANAQSKQNAIATRIAYQAGLKPSELYTIRHEDDSIYSVENRGLRRVIRLNTALAHELERFRLLKPETVIDRGKEYIITYAIGGGQRWSNSFSAASKNNLGWSDGAIGLRHSYAQERINVVRREHKNEEALSIVGKEMGVTAQRVIEFYLKK